MYVIDEWSSISSFPYYLASFTIYLFCNIYLANLFCQEINNNFLTVFLTFFFFYGFDVLGDDDACLL